MIEISNITKSFGEQRVLTDVSTVFEAGKTNLVIGISGSGKTDLMKIMTGLMTPDSGKVHFNGRDFFALSRNDQKNLRREIGMLFQGSALFDSMTVEENVMLPLNMFSNATKKEKLDRVNFCLERVNLAGANKKFPGEISGGMKKRVGIARAIVLNPKYLFWDEANSGLDPRTSIVIDDLIIEITREFNMTTIINTHDMNSVMEIGDHILYLYNGKKQWEGSNKDIIFSKDQLLNDFIFASEFLQDAKQMRMQEAGK